MSPRTFEQNTAIKDERREQILSAALRVFSRRGFAATRISDIVSACGTSHGLLYHYFDSKEHIFIELFKRAIEASSESLLMIEAMPVPPLEKVTRTAAYILDSIAKSEETAYYFLIVVHALIAEGIDEVHDIYRNSAEANTVLSRILRKGQADGTIKEGNCDEMATVFFSAITGLALEKLMVLDFKMPGAETLVNLVKK